MSAHEREQEREERHELRRAVAHRTACAMYGTDDPSERQIEQGGTMWWAWAERSFHLTRLRRQLESLDSWAIRLLAADARTRLQRSAIAAVTAGLTLTDALELSADVDQLLVTLEEERSTCDGEAVDDADGARRSAVDDPQVPL